MKKLTHGWRVIIASMMPIPLASFADVYTNSTSSDDQFLSAIKELNIDGELRSTSSTSRILSKPVKSSVISHQSKSSSGNINLEKRVAILEAKLRKKTKKSKPVAKPSTKAKIDEKNAISVKQFATSLELNGVTKLASQLKEQLQFNEEQLQQQPIDSIKAGLLRTENLALQTRIDALELQNKNDFKKFLANEQQDEKLKERLALLTASNTKLTQERDNLNQSLIDSQNQLADLKQKITNQILSGEKIDDKIKQLTKALNESQQDSEKVKATLEEKEL